MFCDTVGASAQEDMAPGWLAYESELGGTRIRGFNDTVPISFLVLLGCLGGRVQACLHSKGFVHITAFRRLAFSQQQLKSDIRSGFLTFVILFFWFKFWAS